MDVKAETAVTELLRKMIVFFKEVQMFEFWSARKNRSRNVLLSELAGITVWTGGKMWVVYLCIQ